MRTTDLLKHYERIADAPDSISRLRRLVVDLAVRGKLVPQNADDESARLLLKRAAQAKMNLVQSEGFSSFKGDLPRDEGRFSFQVPANWVWCYLDDLAAIARGGSPRPIQSYITDDPAGIPWIKIGDSERGSIYIDATKERVRPEALSKSRMVYPGDLLLSNSMSFGYPYITNVKGCIHDGWLVVRVPDGLINKLFLHKVFLSDYAKSFFAELASGAVVQNLNSEKVRQLPVALPPLAEQHRIVAKVDELMALCNQLEAARVKREATRDRLATSSLARLNTPDPETFPTDTRFALNALPSLTTRPDQIKQLRQTILNLAVRGQLVPQDERDESASNLLNRIAQITGRPPSVGLGAEPFPLPIGWIWSAISDVTTKTGSGSTPRGGKDAYKRSGIPFLRSQNIYDDGLRLNDVAYIDLATHERMSGTAIMAGDLLLNITGGSIGRCCRIAAESAVANISQHVAIIRLAITEMGPYTHVVVRSPYFQGFVIDEQTGAGRGGLPKNRMDRILIPIPPLAEQHRIVAKVDELMALCDQLEANLTTTDNTRRRLLDALLHEALSPEQNIAA